MISPHATRLWSSAKLCILRVTEKSSVVWASAGASSPCTSAAPGVVVISLRLSANTTLLPPGWIGCPPADRANSSTIAAVCNTSVQVFLRLGQFLLSPPWAIKGPLEELKEYRRLAFSLTLEHS